MKKLFVILFILLAFPATSIARNDVLVSQQFFDTSFLISEPPALDSIMMLNDKAQYEWGVSIRNTERGQQAILDADMDQFPMLFSGVFGHKITPETLPETFALLKLVRKCVDKYALGSAKKKYMRIRPYVLYNTNTCYQPTEDELRHNSSYPSGHSGTGWSYALILSEINPAKKNEILQKGFELGQSRVICGYHWQSDVDAARVIASAAVALLHTLPEFQEQFQKAKAEFSRLSKTVN